MKKVVILNDTKKLEPMHEGCALVMKNLSKLCKKNQFEIISTYIKTYKIDKKFQEDIESCDFIIVNGEGTLHHNAGLEIYKQVSYAKTKAKPVYLINTVYQENDKMKEYLNLFDLIATRESFSKKEVIKAGYKGKVIIVPDLTFYNYSNNMKAVGNKSKRVLILDSVFSSIRDKLRAIAKRNNYTFFNMDLQNNLEEIISYYDYIISGRFHGSILALLNNKPCLSIESNTHKTQGLLKDIGLYSTFNKKYFINNRASESKIEKKINKFLQYNFTDYDIKTSNYKKKATILIDNLFQSITEDVR